MVDYPLINKDPRPVLGLVGLYLLFITYGKKFMQQRTAFNVPIAILFLYNFSLVILSIYIVEEVWNRLTKIRKFFILSNSNLFQVNQWSGSSQIQSPMRKIKCVNH